jgi:hypothetical protein
MSIRLPEEQYTTLAGYSAKQAEVIDVLLTEVTEVIVRGLNEVSRLR